MYSEKVMDHFQIPAMLVKFPMQTRLVRLETLSAVIL